MSVATLKSLKRLERATTARQEQDAAAQQEQQFAQHLQNLEQQAEELRQEIPGFDLREALMDERFRTLTSPSNGLSVQDAYFAMHRQELMQGMAAHAIQKTRESVSATIQAGRNRPRENGTRSSAPSLDVKTDPRTLTRADREEIRRRVRAGEKISF